MEILVAVQCMKVMKNRFITNLPTLWIRCLKSRRATLKETATIGSGPNLVRPICALRWVTDMDLWVETKRKSFKTSLEKKNLCEKYFMLKSGNKLISGVWGWRLCNKSWIFNFLRMCQFLESLVLLAPCFFFCFHYLENQALRRQILFCVTTAMR